MDEKNLYCLGLHFKCLFEQGINKKPFDFGEPCENCKYFEGCKGEWQNMRFQLEKETGITIKVVS